MPFRKDNNLLERGCGLWPSFRVWGVVGDPGERDAQISEQRDHVYIP